MPTSVQRRRGTTAEHAVFTGLNGELTVDTTKKTVVVHDGVHAGGFPLASANSPTFSGVVTLSKYINVTEPSGALQVAGVDVLRFGSDTSGQLTGFRNILLNPYIANGINQRNIANWAAVAIGAYGYDRWKKVDANNITQIVEAGNFLPSATYTLSGTGVTTQQLTSPVSGNWTLPNIPITATGIQLELGGIATPLERRPLGLELSLCQRYFQNLPTLNVDYYASTVGVSGYQSICFAVDFRVTPTMGGIPTPSGGGANSSAQAFTGVTARGCSFGVQAAATGRVYFLAAAGANATAEI